MAADNPPTFLAQGTVDRLQSPVDTVMLADRLAQEGVEHELVGFLDRYVGAPE